MKLKIEIDLDGAAFDPFTGDGKFEVGKLLKEIRGALNLQRGWRKILIDSNGNTVGKAVVE